MLSNKTLVLLAVVLLALLAVLRHAGPLLGADAGEGKPAGDFLLPAEASRPAAVRVETGGTSVSLRRSASRWVFAPPGSGRADARRVDLALDAVLRSAVRDRVTPRQREARGLGLAAFGLEPPRARVELEGPGWREAVSVGADTPDGTGVYVLVDGRGDVAVVDRALVDQLPVSPDDFRDRTAFAEPGIEPDALEIRRPGARPVRLERASGSGGSWRFSEPYDCPADAANLGSLLDSLGDATVERFVRVPGTDDSQAAVSAAFAANGLGPDDAVLLLRVWSSGESVPADFTFGGPDPLDERAVFAGSSSEGTVFTVDRSVLDALRMPADLLRERRPFPFAPREILSVSFRSGEGPFSFGRTDALAPWTISEPAKQPASREAVDRFLDALLALRDEAAEPLAPGEPAAPESVLLDLVPAAPAAPASARLSRRPAGPDAAKDAPPDLLVDFPERGIRHVVSGAALPPEALGAAAFAALREPSVLRIPPEEAVSLALRDASGTETALRRDADGTWFRDGGDAPPPGAEAVAAALETLGALEAETAVALFTPDSAAYGLLPPRFELAVGTRDETRPVVILQFGSVRPDGSVHLRVKGEDAVFAVSAETAAALSAPFGR